MKIENVNFAERLMQRPVAPGDSSEVDTRKEAEELEPTAEVLEQKRAHGEEVLDKIKALTEDGTYSVRFEMNDTLGQMIVRVVDPESDEVIRQLPPEEIVGMMEHMHELRGQIVDSAT